MDDDFSGDLAEIIATLASADVVVLRFPTIGKRLLLDFRTSTFDGALVAVVDPVRSVHERYRELQRRRPGLAAPERLHAISWPRPAASLTRSAAWTAIFERIAEGGGRDVMARAARAARELERLEVQAYRDAIRGIGFTTLWAASTATR